MIVAFGGGRSFVDNFLNTTLLVTDDYTLKNYARVTSRPRNVSSTNGNAPLAVHTATDNFISYIRKSAPTAHAPARGNCAARFGSNSTVNVFTLGRCTAPSMAPISKICGLGLICAGTTSNSKD